MGGTIAQHTARGDAVRVLVVTDGSSSQYPGDAAIRARKEEEAVSAARELGVSDYVHLDLPDMRLDTVPHVELNEIVQEQLAGAPPRSCTPCSPTSISTIVRCSTLSQSQPGRCRDRAVRRVLTYAPTSSTEWTPAALNWFVPNWYVDVRPRSSRKSPRSRGTRRSTRVPASAKRTRDPGRRRIPRHECGCEYAEPFLPRPQPRTAVEPRRGPAARRRSSFSRLVGATAAAFAYTERLKLERARSPARGRPGVLAGLRVRARHRRDLLRAAKERKRHLDMLDEDGGPCGGSSATAGSSAGAWRTRGTAGTRPAYRRRMVAYRPRVQLDEHRRTLVLPNPIRVDTRPPRILAAPGLPARLLARRRRATRPSDRPLRARRAGARHDARRRTAARAREVPRARGPARLVRAREREIGPPGAYKIRLRAFDRAGNRSSSRREYRCASATSSCRAIDRGRRGEALLGARDTDGRGVCWLSGGRGAARRGCSCCAPRARRAATVFVEAERPPRQARAVVRPRARLPRCTPKRPTLPSSSLLPSSSASSPCRVLLLAAGATPSCAARRRRVRPPSAPARPPKLVRASRGRPTATTRRARASRRVDHRPPFRALWTVRARPLPRVPAGRRLRPRLSSPSRSGRFFAIDARPARALEQALPALLAASPTVGTASSTRR